jgi:hypothetical protein
LAQAFDPELQEEDLYERVLVRLRTAHARSGAMDPLVPRGLWNFDTTFELIRSVEAKKVLELLSTLRSEGVL